VNDNETQPRVHGIPPYGLAQTLTGGDGAAQTQVLSAAQDGTGSAPQGPRGAETLTDAPTFAPVFAAAGGAADSASFPNQVGGRAAADGTTSKRSKKTKLATEDEEEDEPRGAFRTFLSIFGTVLLLILCALAVLVAGVPAVVHGQSLAVLTGSMEPTIMPGDLIVVEGVQSDSAKENLKIGNIISYEPKADDPTLITHRIVAKGSGVSGNYFITQGDNNNAKDAPVYMKQVVGKYLYKLPKLGYLTQWLGGSKRGAVMILGIALILFGIYRVVFGRKDKKAREAEEKAELDQKVEAEIQARLGYVPTSGNAGPGVAAPAGSAAPQRRSAAVPAAVAVAEPPVAAGGAFAAMLGAQANAATDVDGTVPASSAVPADTTTTHTQPIPQATPAAAAVPTSAAEMPNPATAEANVPAPTAAPASGTPQTQDGQTATPPAGVSATGVPLTRRQMREARERELAQEHTDEASQ
jgi:signal peptidase